MKINQYCSVCKQHLDMEVIPTEDAGDDGVIWLRCPQCQGYLPKFSGQGKLAPAPAAADSADDATDPAFTKTTPPGRARSSEVADRDVPTADAPQAAAEEPERVPDPAETAPRDDKIAEYAAALQDADLSRARPYRPTEVFAVGDVVHHLAYDDIGVVVAKETLPGGRQAVKVYFQEAGVVHLIEQLPADGR